MVIFFWIFLWNSWGYHGDFPYNQVWFFAVVFCHRRGSKIPEAMIDLNGGFSS